MSDSEETMETSGGNAGSAIAWLRVLVAILVPASAVLSMAFAKWHTVFLVAAIILFCNTVVGIAGATKGPARSFRMWAGLIAALASFAQACAALLYANLASHWNG